MSKKKTPKQTARRAIELFRDARFGTKVVKSRKAYDRKRDKRAGIQETESGVPVNAMGGSSSTHGTGNIDTYDPLLQVSKRKLKKFSMFKRKSPVDGRSE